MAAGLTFCHTTCCFIWWHSILYMLECLLKQSASSQPVWAQGSTQMSPFFWHSSASISWRSDICQAGFPRFGDRSQVLSTHLWANINPSSYGGRRLERTPWTSTTPNDRIMLLSNAGRQRWGKTQIRLTSGGYTDSLLWHSIQQNSSSTYIWLDVRTLSLSLSLCPIQMQFPPHFGSVQLVCTPWSGAGIQSDLWQWCQLCGLSFCQFSADGLQESPFPSS